MTAASGKPRSAILESLQDCKAAFRTVGVFSAVINLLMLAPAVYMLQVYDRVLPSRNETTLVMLTLITLGLFLLMAGLDHARSFIVIRLGSQLDLKLNQRVYTAAFEANLRSGGFNAAQALNDLTTLRQFVTGQPLFAFFDAPWFPVYALVLFLFHPMLGAFALGGAVLLVALAWLNERLSGAPLAEAGKLSIQSGQLAATTLRNAEVIDAMGMLPALRRRWFRLHEQFLDRQRVASEKSAVVSAASRTARITLQSLILGLGALLAVEGSITPGMMIAGSILMGRMLAPIDAIIGVWKQLSASRQAYQRLDGLLESFPERESGMPLRAPEGRLQVEAVSASVPGGRTAVLQRVSFALEPGDVLGLVGPSASGKSTLARLLVGVWPAAAGAVRLDGADIYRWNKEELGPAIGYLPQDVELFAGTIGENIARFGKVDAEKVIVAAELAGVHELILHFPQGYDTVLGENGAGLSGGQKQRIGLARALYGNPALIILDEPNSNLDEAGEAALFRAIEKLKSRGATVVIITHRHNILSATSKLLLMRSGSVQAFGPTLQVLTAMQEAASKEAAGQKNTAASYAQTSPYAVPRKPVQLVEGGA